MNKLELLAREAADLGHRGDKLGMVIVSQYGDGQWQVTVHVHNEFAVANCDDPTAETPVMRETSHDLDTVLDRMLARVRDAVAATPAVEVA